MKVRRAFCCVTAIIILVLGGSGLAAAQAVGHLTKVEGRVDILKGGNLPATQAKLNDPVAAKDVIRTKSLSKAEITFVDNSVVTISPESRLAVEEYSVDTAQGKRQAVLEVFQGLALAVVNKIFKSAEPDFVVKTHTAIMGVRGTEFGIRVQPNASTILNFQGLTQVGNVFPEVTQLFRKAFKVAYAFGPMDEKSSRWVLLKDMQGTTVARNLPPTLPFAVSPEEREMFLHQLAAGLSSGKGSGADSSLGSLTGKAGATGNLLATNVLTDSSSLGLITGTGNTALTLVNAITVPPTVLPQQQLAQTQPGGTTPAPIAGVAMPVFNILTIWGSGGVDLDLHLTGPMGRALFMFFMATPAV